MAASIGCLGLALKSLPVGTAYAVWTGIGTVGTAALGIYLFNEPATLLRLSCIGLILSGIIGLKILIGRAARCGSRGRLKNSSPTCRAAGYRAWRSGRRRQMRHSARTRRVSAPNPIFSTHGLF